MRYYYFAKEEKYKITNIMEETIMTKYVAVCQWCGQRGSYVSRSDDRPPMYTPQVPGKCKGHPSGKPNMPHNPKWEEC